MGLVRIVILTFLFASIAVIGNVFFMKRVDIPAHMLHHPSVFQENLLSVKQAEELMNLAKEMKEFPTNAADLKFYDTKHEHIGEARPIGSDGKCDHPYLIPSVNGTLCVLPGRIDVGRHYILSGGVQAIKEVYEDQVARLLSFGRYMFEYKKYPVVSELFHSERFQNSAKAVCPKDKQVLDPFQFNFIAQLPGQTVALHIDGVYFWGATRFQIPQWLLAAMQFSGLFNDRFIDQIQVVGYFHKWEATPERGGDFVYWDTESQYPHSVPPLSRAGSVVDGSKVVHAATVYQKHVKAPKLDKSNDNVLTYVGDDKWHLLSNGVVTNKYVTDDIRWTIVYRARCFASEEEIQRFANFPDEETLQLEDVLTTFTNDLVARGKLSVGQQIDRLDLATLIMDEYIKYPLSPYAVIPFNYCAISKLYPWAGPLFSLFC